jgi:hypothetical protein
MLIDGVIVMSWFCEHASVCIIIVLYICYEDIMHNKAYLRKQIFSIKKYGANFAFVRVSFIT